MHFIRAIVTSTFYISNNACSSDKRLLRLSSDRHAVVSSSCIVLDLKTVVLKGKDQIDTIIHTTIEITLGPQRLQDHISWLDYVCKRESVVHKKRRTRLA
jgi:hypothetical protein